MIASGATELCGSSPSRRATSLEGSEPIAWPSRIDRPGARLEHPREPAQQRRLAARVGADDGGERAVGDRDVERLGDDAAVVGEREVVALQAAHARHSRTSSQRQVDAAEHAGQHAHRELDVAGDPLARAVGAEQQHAARQRGAGDARAAGAREPAGDLRRGERDEHDRPRRRGRHRGQRDGDEDQREPRPRDADAERARGVVAELEHPQLAREQRDRPARARSAQRRSGARAPSRGR